MQNLAFFRLHGPRCKHFSTSEEFDGCSDTLFNGYCLSNIRRPTFIDISFLSTSWFFIIIAHSVLTSILLQKDTSLTDFCPLTWYSGA